MAHICVQSAERTRQNTECHKHDVMSVMIVNPSTSDLVS